VEVEVEFVALVEAAVPGVRVGEEEIRREDEVERAVANIASYSSSVRPKKATKGIRNPTLKRIESTRWRATRRPRAA
jgi:hypothetical protein